MIMWGGGGTWHDGVNVASLLQACQISSHHLVALPLDRTCLQGWADYRSRSRQRGSAVAVSLVWMQLVGRRWVESGMDWMCSVCSFFGTAIVGNRGSGSFVGCNQCPGGAGRQSVLPLLGGVEWTC